MIFDGSSDGILDGSSEGSSDGVLDGSPEGSSDGILDGSPEGSSDGILDGSPEGSSDGLSNGAEDGIEDGSNEGTKDEGVELETKLGVLLGFPVGESVGAEVFSLFPNTRPNFSSDERYFVPKYLALHFLS